MSHDDVGNFFHVYSQLSGGAMVDQAWLDAVGQKLLCRDCHSILRYEELPEVRLMTPPGGAVDVVWGMDLAVVSMRLLDELGREEMQQYLRVGRLLDSRGKPNKSYVSFQGNHRTFFRGTEESTYRGLCPSCGSPLFHATGLTADLYLLRERVPPVPVSESQIWGLVMTGEYVSRISPAMRRRLRIYPLPIIDEPRDGLGDLPF